MLTNNGGQTGTHALPSGSPAIDSGDSDQTADQRGVSRPRDGDNDGSAIDDIGAFEKEASPNTAPEITADVPTKTRDKTSTLTATVTDNESDLSSSQIQVFIERGGYGLQV